MSDFISIGKVTKPHGVRGEIFVRLDWPKAPWLDQVSQVRLCSPKGDAQDFTVFQARPHKEGLLVKLEGLDTMDMAEKLRGYQFQVPAHIFHTADANDFYLSEVVGFEVQDPEGRTLGVISGFENGPSQDRALIQSETGVYAVPFVRQIWQNLNFEDKTIVMNVPEGLRDLNP